MLHRVPWVVVLVAALGCTRSNPLALPGEDLAMPGGPVDLATPAPHDLAGADLRSPRHDLAAPSSDLAIAPGRDLAVAAGVACANATCSPGDTCCVTSVGASCVAPGGSCAGVTVVCDGPAQCMSGEICCGSTRTGTSCQTGSCSANTVQLCQSAADCASGYCCPVPNTTYSYCASRPC